MRPSDARKLRQADTFEQWQEIADALDQKSGAFSWRKDPNSKLYDAGLLQEQLHLIRDLRISAETESHNTIGHDSHGARLASVLMESMYRHLGEITNPVLYQRALGGTKFIISEFIEEVGASMRFLARHPSLDLTDEQKLQAFELAYRNYGSSALVLSGGMAFGIYHLGVVKALWEQRLLPSVVSGSSMGSIVAAGVCTRSDAELNTFFEHLEDVHRQAVKFDWDAIKRLKGVLDPAQLREHIECNVGVMTFAEAYERSGRILNITVSPTRSRQKPRVLNYRTAPDVLVTEAAMASCAIPGAFPPVMLKARDASGSIVPYMPTERWIDGSVHSDVPLERLGRLLNVNHTIVSQANPVVLPFAENVVKRGLIPFVSHTASSMVRAQLGEVLDAARGASGHTGLTPWLDRAVSVTRQTYLGDINIQFPFKPGMYRKLSKNPSFKGLQNYVHSGEAATWPRIAAIHDQTLLCRTFEECIGHLRSTMRSEDRSN